MRRCHRMPFGAELQPDGQVRFRLWAPGIRSPELILVRAHGSASFPLSAEADGWFELTTDEAEPGTYYRYRLEDGTEVPDPASRFQPQDVHGPSEVIDPEAWEWSDDTWRGRPWEEAVIYELHVGTFTRRGNYSGVRERLGYLRDLGVTAVELMPLADFAGRRNWGYDGVLPFAPDDSYGSPAALKDLVEAAHAEGLMVYHDVVYNHFGPEGNYLHLYAPPFFSTKHFTPWGPALNFDGPDSHWVRQYFIQQALYWLEEYHFDGLRLDAVHAIVDDSTPSFIEELADAVSSGPGRERHIHLILENDANEARYMSRDPSGPNARYRAQWNDDLHHALHVLTTGETNGYYMDYKDAPLSHLGRCLSEGFAYQGEPSPFRGQRPRGEKSGNLPATAFVSFLQNHDQIGGRAFGERISRLAPPSAVQAAAAVVLLSPQIPLLFMGEEWATQAPFLFFCDFEEDLREAVREGRLREFARFPGFDDPAQRHRIPDPCAEAAFESCVLDWSENATSHYADSLRFHKELLALRRKEIVPMLHRLVPGRAAADERNGALRVRWVMDEGALLLLANLSETTAGGQTVPEGRCIYVTPGAWESLAAGSLPPWSIVWSKAGTSEAVTD